jgi:hypothetical protein
VCDAGIDHASAGAATVFNNGMRRASVKIYFSADGRQHDPSGPAFLAFTIVVESYDCGKRMLYEESTEFHNSDGSVHTFDSSRSPNWYPAPEIKATDPTLDFVCEWKSKVDGEARSS